MVNNKQFNEVIRRIISKIENDTPKEELIEYLSLLDADKMLEGDMPMAELNLYLESIAELAEKEAKTVEDVVKIIRGSKLII